MKIIKIKIMKLKMYASRTTVQRDGEVLVLDSVLLDQAHGALRPRMGRFNAMATIILVGPLAKTLLHGGSARVAVGSPKVPLLCAVSPVAEAEGAIVRLAGVSVEAIATAVRERLVGLPQVLGDDPWARKW